MSNGMITLADSLREWNGMDRPLRNLTKEQLWKYPLADPSSDAEWAFSREVMGRIVAYRAHEEQVNKAKAEIPRAEQMLRSTKVNLAKARESQAEAELHGQGTIHADSIKGMERSVASAEAALKRTQARAQQLADELATDSKRDDLINPTEVQTYYVRRYAGEWNKILQSWQEGTLMVAQTYGWGSFLVARGSTVAEDTKAYRHAEGIATLVAQIDGPSFQAMRALWQTRVMPTTHARREFLSDNESTGVVELAGLKPEQRRRYWQWWRAYNNMTLRYQWTDDSGIAYDERSFNPNKPGPEERDDD
jgi:hypothetical protein